METSMFINIFSSFFFVVYLLVAFVWPTIRTHRNTGINPITFGNSDNAHDFIGLWFKIIIGLIPVSIVFYWLGEDTYKYLLPVFYLKAPEMQGLGAILFVISLVWTSIAQLQMGNSWRIGLDKEHETKLVQHGLFSKSRNPVFLGMLVSLSGFFLLLPNAVTLLVLIAGYLLIHIQIRLEEEFLLKQHGTRYAIYCEKVRRLI